MSTSFFDHLPQLGVGPGYQPLTLSELSTHQVLLIGLGREGRSSYNFIRQHFPTLEILAFDDKDPTQLAEWQVPQSQDQHLTFFNQADELVTALKSSLTPTLAIKTAGWPPSHELLKALNDVTIARWSSNTQLFFDLLPSETSSIVVIGVTGTKGKSTTTSLIHHVLKTTGHSAWLGGNIGIPPLDLLATIKTQQATELQKGPAEAEFVALELSCHQLAELHHSPQIAVIQNIVPEHLDFYGDFESYVAAKSQITRWQHPSNYVIYSPEFETATQVATLSPGQQLTFKIDSAELKLDGEVLMSTEQLPLLGSHNLYNMMPAALIGKLMGLENKALIKALKSFKALPHRLELAGTVNDVEYYNDSLSTVPEATMAALEAFDDRPVVLIAGGYDRGLDFSNLTEAIVDQAVTQVILFRPTGDKIWAALKHEVPVTATKLESADTSEAYQLGEISVYFVSDMDQAVTQAHQVASPGSVVLMSPASPSFGRFLDYAERGEAFKQAVAQLA